MALDVADTRQALALAERLPAAEWVKVGLQLFAAAGPSIVRELRERDRRVFLDLKLHDIPNTVAGAVEAAAALEVDLLTLHASGGAAMLQAARAAAEVRGGRLQLLAVTLLTSLSEGEVAGLWGRSYVSIAEEVVRLAELAAAAGMHGVVASVGEARQVRSRCGPDLWVLTPGIRLPGDAPGDQARVATPAEAARAGADYLVIGRSVTAAADPMAAFDRVLASISGSDPHEGSSS
ncbi:MAG TPA: orotidine-5'-phosphate decarboxylase [Longimicrobiaceae bacterium]|nr:orotidine-5'-phosphate decarboxylase [Longimicrobiaceae bacterium]